MRDDPDHPPVDPAVLEQAAEWFAVLRDERVTAVDRRRWQAWLQAGPEQRRAWERVEAIEQRFRRLPPEPARAALEAAGGTRRRALKVLAALAVGGPALWAGWRAAPLAQWQADYRTAVGEIGEFVLADGTRVWLNTASALDVDYSPTVRRLILVAGEVLIETAADPAARPLLVETEAGTVRPLGTRLSVRDRDGRVAVRVYVGRARVEPAAAADAAYTLEVGRQSVFSPLEASPPEPLDTTDPVWARGVLLADDMRLADFLAELTRYRRGYLGHDPEVAELRLVGAFPLHDTDRVLAALEATLPVRIQHLGPWWVRVVPR